MSAKSKERKLEATAKERTEKDPTKGGSARNKPQREKERERERERKCTEKSPAKEPTEKGADVERKQKITGKRLRGKMPPRKSLWKLFSQKTERNMNPRTAHGKDPAKEHGGKALRERSRKKMCKR